MRRVVFGLLAALLACLAGIGVGFYFRGISAGGGGGDGMPSREQVRRYMGEFAASQYDKILMYNNRSEGLLRVGDRAPALTLADLEGTPRPISAYYEDKPLVLSFGSYT